MKLLTFRTKCIGFKYFVAKAAIIFRLFLKTPKVKKKLIRKEKIDIVYTIQ